MKKFLSLVLALIMVMSLVTVGAGAVEFSDAEEITQVEAVGVMAGLGILEGYDDGSFNPEGTLTRGAAAKIITYMLEGTVKAEARKAAGVAKAPFPDVPTTSSNAAFIAFCAEKGIVSGRSDGTFRRGDPLTGNAFLKMVLVALGVTDIDFNSTTNPGWPIDAVARATEMNLLVDIDKDVVYSNPLTRENACAIALAALQDSPTGSDGYIVSALTNNATVADVVAEGKVYETRADAIAELAGTNAVYGTDYTVVKAPASDSLAKKHWNLTETTRTDGFGRVTDIWTNGKASTAKDYVEYAAFEREPVLTINTALANGNAVRKALGYKTADYSNATFSTVKLNGGTYPGTFSTGNGTVVEVYKGTKTGDVQDYTMLVITTTAKTLVAGDFVAANNADTVEKQAHIWIDLDGDTTKEKGETVLAEGFKAGDVVLYTAGTKGIESFEKAKTVSGKVTAVAGDKSYIRIAGEKYVMSAAALDAANSIETGATRYAYGTTTYTYYLDNYNNIIKAVNYTTEAAEIDTNYLYIFESASMLDNGSGLLNAEDSYAEAQVKAYDLATGEIGLKNLAVVKNSSGTWKYAKVDGKASGISVDNTLALPAGLYEYTTLEDGTIVLIDGNTSDTDTAAAPADVAATTTISTAKNNAVIATSPDALTATSATTMTVVKLVSEDSKIVSGTSTTVTGIANFSTYNTIGAIVTADEDTGIVSNILYVVVDASTSSTVKYATFKGLGEAGADGQLYAFYVKGELVEYAVAESNTVTLTSTDAGKVFNLSLEDGKLTNLANTAALTADASNVTVTYIDDTFMIVDNSGTASVVYFASTCTVVDKDDSYATAELAVDDVITIYNATSGSDSGKVAFVVIDNA